MTNIETLGITEGAAMDLILDACRANESREVRNLRDGFRVHFNVKADGDHIAVLSDSEGTTVALATVDRFDC